MAEIDDLIAARLVRSGDVVFDIGAYHDDIISSYLAAGAQEIHAFEPQPDSFAVIAAAYADRPMVHLHNLALGAVDGATDLIEPAGKNGKGSIDPGFARRSAEAMATGMQRRPVACARLDSLSLGPADFWKIDAEGVENQIVAGAEATLASTPPRILQVEIFSIPYNERGHQPRTIANIGRFFRHCCLAGITEVDELGLYGLNPRTREEGETAIRASRRGGPPTYVFSHEPLVPNPQPLAD